MTRVAVAMDMRIDPPSGVSKKAAALSTALDFLDRAIVIMDENGVSIAAAHADTAREALKSAISSAAD